MCVAGGECEEEIWSADRQHVESDDCPGLVIITIAFFTPPDCPSVVKYHCDIIFA